MPEAGAELRRPGCWRVGASGREAGQDTGHMGDDGHAAAEGRWRTPLLVGAGVLLLLATRACHPIAGLGNADIAGIFYEADLIVGGGVPYVDTIDMKSPGTFFLLAGVFAGLGRELWCVEVAYILWTALAGPAIWVAARALYGRSETAGLAVLLYLGWIGTFDYNYSAWMTPAYAWAFACLIAAVRWQKGWLHAAAGACAALALALKGQSVVLAPVFVLVWLWGRRRGEPGATWSAWPLWIFGAALGVAPLFAWYAAHGATHQLVMALVPIGVAREYASRVQPDDLWILKIWRIPWQHMRVFPLHSLLFGAVLVGAWWYRRARKRGDVLEAGPGLASRPSGPDFAAPLAPQLIFWAMSVVGCGLGGWRFYVHYLTQDLPALALIAVHPLGVAWWLARREKWGAGLLVVTAATSLILIARIPLGYAQNVDHRGNKHTVEIGAYIKERTRPDETILVWGWTAWSTYYHAERRSPSAIFKVLGQATEYNQNGMFTRSLATNFKDGPQADRLLADVRRAPPAYIIKPPVFFPGAKRDPMTQWPAMMRFFRAN